MNRQLFQFFGLQENPFCMSPYPSYLLVNRKTQSTLDQMADGIQSGKGLLVLTGEVGTGKTTLVKRLIEWSKQQGIQTAFIFNARLEPVEFFEMVLGGYGALNNRQLRGNPRQRLNQWLIEQKAAGVRPVLFIDEAQGVPLGTLEEVRLLLNQEFMGEKVIQIVLSGQPELGEVLRRPELRHLRQRIELLLQTAPFDRDESRGYIQKRIDVAGAEGKSVFPAEAAEAVYFYAHGVPRVMNLLCEHGLRRAYARNFLSVSPEIVDEVARELQFQECRPISKREVAAEIISDTASDPTESPADGATSLDAAASAEIAVPAALAALQETHAPVADAVQMKAELIAPPVFETHAVEQAVLAQPIQLATLAEAPGSSLSVLPYVEAKTITRVAERSPLRVGHPIPVRAQEQEYASDITAIVRAEGPERHWIQTRRATLELRFTLSIASVFNQSWQRWQERYAALGKWLCKPMPFGHRRARRVFDRPSTA
jgi:general secretion pathway protein A